MTAATLSPNSNKFGLAGGAQPLILLPVHVNDRGPFDFILDTGAGTSLLSSELAKQLETRVIGSKEGQSAGGKVSVSLAKVDSISVGETKLHDVDVGIVDLAQIGKTIGAKIDGDLGYNFLKHFASRSTTVIVKFVLTIRSVSKVLVAARKRQCQFVWPVRRSRSFWWTCTQTGADRFSLRLIPAHRLQRSRPNLPKNSELKVRRWA